MNLYAAFGFGFSTRDDSNMCNSSSLNTPLRLAIIAFPRASACQFAAQDSRGKREHQPKAVVGLAQSLDSPGRQGLLSPSTPDRENPKPMPIPDDIRTEAEAHLDQYCVGLIPKHVQDQIRIGYVAKGMAITLFEQRPG